MKQEALEVLRNRREKRKFKPQQITAEELNAVLEAGTWAATGRGMQSPVIVVVQDAETVAQLSRMNAGVLGVDSDPFYGAKTILAALVRDGLPSAALRVDSGRKGQDNAVMPVCAPDWCARFPLENGG